MISLSLLDEKQLLVKLREGDHCAFDHIYTNYKIQLAARLFALLKYDHLVEDALQELFYRIWVNRDQIDCEKSILPYMYRIAANLAYDHIRQVVKEQKAILSGDITFMTESEQNSQKEIDAVLYQLIDELPEQCRKVFLLCKIEKKSYEETARLLGISTNAVKKHIIKGNSFIKANSHKLAPWIISFILLQQFK